MTSLKEFPRECHSSSQTFLLFLFICFIIIIIIIIIPNVNDKYILSGTDFFLVCKYAEKNYFCVFSLSFSMVKVIMSFVKDLCPKDPQQITNYFGKHIKIHSN